jgi:hypothetical protein
MIETVYYNNGDVYKETFLKTGVSMDNSMSFSINKKTNIRKDYYDYKPNNKNIWGFFSIKGGTIKKYYKSKYICDIEGVEMNINADISHIEIPQSMNNQISIAKDTDSTEVFFIIDDYKNMQDVANFYNLPTPLEDNNDFDTDNSKWCNTVLPPITPIDKNYEYKNIRCKLGSVKYIDGVAKVFKVYQTNRK